MKPAELTKQIEDRAAATSGGGSASTTMNAAGAAGGTSKAESAGTANAAESAGAAAGAAAGAPTESHVENEASAAAETSRYVLEMEGWLACRVEPASCIEAMRHAPVLPAQPHVKPRRTHPTSSTNTWSSAATTAATTDDSADGAELVWDAHTDETTGQTYYYCASTGVTSWGEADLTTWDRHEHDGKPYWYNRITRRTSWTNPG